MTDRTHPDSGVPFTYGNYVNYAEHVQALHARIAELEAELEAVGAGGVQALAASAPVAPAQPAIIERKVYKGTPEHREYLAARFPRNGGSTSNSFEWQGHRWAYYWTSFNDAGEYDLIYRHTPKAAPVAPAPQPAKDHQDAEDTALLDWLSRAGTTTICLVMDRPHDGEIEVSTDDGPTGYGKTLRDAIRAARAQQKGGEPA